MRSDVGRHGAEGRWLILTMAVALMSAAIAVAVGTSSAWPEFLLLSAVLFGSLALHRRTPLWELSPVAVLLFSYLAIALFGPLLAAAASEALGAGARISLSAQESTDTFVVFITAAGATILGAFIVSLAGSPKPISSKSSKRDVRRPRWTAGVFAMTPAILTIVAYRGALLERPDYLVGQTGSPLLTTVHVLAIPAVVTLGWLGKSASRMRGKVLSYAGILIYMVLLFSLATRALSLVPVLVAFGILAADPSSKKSHVLLLVAAIASILLLQTPLALRGSSEHGLIPYLTTLFDQPSLSSGLEAAGNNILFSYALTGAVAFHVHPIGWSWALVSLDPRPGQFTDWYAIQPLLRVNPATPDNTLGELASLGLWPVFGFFVAVGAVFGYVDRRIRQLLSDGDTFAALLLFALAAFFVLESLQYNLRSSSRFIYYLLVADVAIRLWRRWRHHKRVEVVFDSHEAAAHHRSRIAGEGIRSVANQAP